jgi:hypothetical protein
MNLRRIIGIVVAIAGIALLCVSSYIKGQVAEGQEQIDSAQKKVDTGNRLFSLSPTVKEYSKGLTDSAQKKIDAGQEQVIEYTALAQKLQIGGYILIAVGALLILLPKKKA